MTGTLTTVLQVVALSLAGGLGVATALVREPLRQVVVYSCFGLSLVLVFATLMAPDVGISEVAISSIAAPMVLLPAVFRTHGGGRG